MRTLLVQLDCPWPALSGSDIRNSHIARTMAGHGPALCLALWRPTTGNSTTPEVECLMPGTLVNAWRLGDPRVPTRFNIERSHLDWLMAQARKFEPDTIVIEGVGLARAAEMLRALPARMVLDMHNIESALAAAQLKNQPWHKRLTRIWSESRRMGAARALDASLSHLADAVWVCSQRDKETLSQLGGAAAHLVPNVLPDERVFTIPIEAGRYRNAVPLFCGHLSYFPNKRAVLELARKVAPLLPGGRTKPVVAGRSPSRSIARLARNGKIELVDSPADMMPLLGKHSLAVLPIRHGGGTRIKVLEAMAAGIVVIATEKAVEGLDVVDGVHFLHAETPPQMAEAAKRVAARPDAAADLARRARAFVSENHRHGAMRAAITAALGCLEKTTSA